MTDDKMVKNFLVVVIILHVNGPNVVIVAKMKCCHTHVYNMTVTVCPSTGSQLEVIKQNEQVLSST